MFLKYFIKHYEPFGHDRILKKKRFFISLLPNNKSNFVDVNFVYSIFQLKRLRFTSTKKQTCRVYEGSPNVTEHLSVKCSSQASSRRSLVDKATIVSVTTLAKMKTITLDFTSTSERFQVFISSCKTSSLSSM